MWGDSRLCIGRKPLLSRSIMQFHRRRWGHRPSMRRKPKLGGHSLALCSSFVLEQPRSCTGRRAWQVSLAVQASLLRLLDDRRCPPTSAKTPLLALECNQVGAFLLLVLDYNKARFGTRTQTQTQTLTLPGLPVIWRPRYLRPQNRQLEPLFRVQ